MAFLATVHIGGDVVALQSRLALYTSVCSRHNLEVRLHGLRKKDVLVCIGDEAPNTDREFSPRPRLGLYDSATVES
jgi:hypothetical protein